MSAIESTQAPTTMSQAIPRFSGKAVAWLSFCFGTPTGLLLLAENWRRLGQGDRAAKYAVGGVLVLLALVVMSSLLEPVAGLAILFGQILTLKYLAGKVGDAEFALTHGGKCFVHRNALLGLGIGVAVLGAALLLSIALLIMRLIVLG